MRVGSLALAAVPAIAGDAAALGWLFMALLAIEEGQGGATPSEPPPALAPLWPAIAEQQRALHAAAEATRKARAAAGRIGGQRKAANARKAALALASAHTRAHAKNRAAQSDECHTDRGDNGGVYRIGGVGGRKSEGETGGGFLANARRITDYSQIFDISVAPEAVALAVTGEPPTAAAAAAYRALAARLGETRFRAAVASFWGEARLGEHAADERPGAVLVARLKAALA